MNAKIRALLGLAAALLLGFTLGFPTQAHAAEAAAGHGKASLDGFSATGLKLTQTQQTAAKKLHAEAVAKSEPLIAQQHQQMMEIHTMLEGANPNAAEIGQKMIAAHATGKQLMALHEEVASRFSELLTAGQRTKFQAQKEKYLREQHIPSSR